MIKKAHICQILLTLSCLLPKISDMPRTFQRPFPSVEKQIRAFAERLKLARMRRGMSTSLFAERLGVSRDTLNRLEKGDGNIAIGTYMRALRILGLDADMDAVARDDELGRKLQDLNLPSRISPSKRTRAKKPAVSPDQPPSKTPPEES
jgi:transcriptional regulator with XRE-family HTH domain